MKKIMAVLVSIAMLFAFAACDNSTSNPYFGRQVSSVTLQSAPEYIVGETINPADIRLLVIYDNGSEVITGDKVGLNGTFITEASNVADGSKFTFKYGSYSALDGENYGTAKDWDIIVPVYAIEGLNIDTSAAGTTVEVGKGSLSSVALLSGAKFTLVYNNGKTREVSLTDLSSVYGITVNATAAATEENLDKEVKVSVTATGTNLPENTTKVSPSEWNVKVVSDQSKVVSKVELVPTEDFEAFVDHTKLEDLKYDIVFTYADNSTKTFSSTGITTYGTAADLTATDGVTDCNIKVEFKDYANGSYVLTKTDSSLVATVTATFDNLEAQVVKAAAMKVPFVEDYAVKIVAEKKDGSVKIYPEQELSKDSFKFKVVEYASGDKPKTGEEPTIESNKIVLDTKRVNYGVAAGEKFTIEFSWDAETVIPVVIDDLEITVDNPEA